MNKTKLKILFFYVHPAKFHLFKNAIKLLEREGHQVDIVISNKEVLSDLLETANVKFTNLFPEGRKISFLPSKVNAAIGLIRTIWKLWLYSRKKNYDIYVTDDVLSILGKLQGIPSIIFTDNDLSTVPLIKIIFSAADKIIAPEATKLDNLTYKKISFKGNKAIAHLHPQYFESNSNVLEKYKIENKQICIIRLSKLNASHDAHGNPGITNLDLSEIINFLSPNYQIIISTERSLPEEFNKYIHNIEPIDFTDILFNASFFIGDSSTMATEAAILGIPNILINNIAKNLSVLVEMRDKYKIHYFFDSFKEAESNLIEMINNKETKDLFKKNALIYIDNCDDFNSILFNEITKFKPL